MGIGNWSQFYEPGAMFVLALHAGGKLQGKTGFAGAAGTGEGEQPRLGECRANLCQFAGTADESGEVGRQIAGRRSSGFQGGKSTLRSGAMSW